MILTVSPLSWAAETFISPDDDLPEPRVEVLDLNLPEQAMSIEVQAAMEEERNQPIRDEQGRIHYIVDLVDEVDKGHSDKTPMDERLGNWHKPATVGAIHGFEAKYKLKATGMFSWVGKGFAAYLTPQQLKALQRNPKVKQITEDRKTDSIINWVNNPLVETPQMELATEEIAESDTLSDSAFMVDEQLVTTEQVPWNIAAVGGNKLSNGSTRVYVLDSGVGKHVDLPNVITRDSAVTGVPVVGCYPHATHVAGIISAPRNGFGRVGVNSSVPIVSVSVSSITSPSNCGTNPPFIGISSAAITAGLDKIKALITARNRVGVINISMNNSLGEFATTKSLGQKLRSVASTAAGYPGAFIAQSAGNFATDACQYAYTSAGNIDGIMVVGATDINGQPVVQLNSVKQPNGTMVFIDGFRNLPNAGDEPGSNYGRCVEIWAPGNGIDSTWASNPQSSNNTYDQYEKLSGTSMAAPHVAGIAAWLVESRNLTAPEQIESDIKNLAYANGAIDPDPSNLTAGVPVQIRMARTDGVGTIMAKPTVEFAIAGKPVIPGTPSENYATTSQSPFTLSYGSVGAQTCSLTAYLNNAIWYQHPNFRPKYDWGTVQLAAGTYRWVVNCRSTTNTTSSAQVMATITDPLPKPTAYFYYKNQKQSNAAYVKIPYNTLPFNFSYTSTNTETCRLNPYHTNNNGVWETWYTAPYPMPIHYNWGEVYLQPNNYRWELTCTGIGGSITTNFYLNVY